MAKELVKIPYKMTPIPPAIEIRSLVTVHCYEYRRNFSFDGEVHNFWEFICVDRGDVDITAGNRKVRLHKDEIAFHQPMEFHDVHTSPTSAPNLIVISFDCRSEAMDFFRGKILKIDAEERQLLALILQQARTCFDCRLDDPYLDRLTVRKNLPEGSLQILVLHLTLFLLHLMQRTEKGRQNPEKSPSAAATPAKFSTTENADLLYAQVCQYMRDHLNCRLTIRQICRDNLLSRPRLMSLFHQKTGGGPMETFSQMKIDEAKRQIRSSDKQFSRIASDLGYSSPGYFSRQFRKVTDMSPSEYAGSIEALSERKN